MSLLEELFEQAEKYGNVRIFSSEEKQAPNCYHATISFNTISHVTLKAESSRYDHKIEDALVEAIRKAVEIVDSISSSGVDTAQTIKFLERW